MINFNNKNGSEFLIKLSDDSCKVYDGVNTVFGEVADKDV